MSFEYVAVYSKNLILISKGILWIENDPLKQMYKYIKLGSDKNAKSFFWI